MKPRENHSRPLVGVFVRKKFLRQGKVKKFARKLYQANEKARLPVYFFAAHDVDWKRKRIDGSVLEGGRRWVERSMPFPDIIYDRGTGFGGEERRAAEELRARFKKQPGVEFINSCKLKKWQMHQKLSKHMEVKKYLPETTFSQGMDDIREAVNRYGYLFLKSSGGSGGRKVFVLEKQGGGFSCHYYHQGRHVKRDFSTLDPLAREMKKIGLKPDGVIIQQGIRLLKYKSRLLDLRVLLVKDRRGRWTAVYNQARLAQKGRVITNLSLGGDVMDYGDIFRGLKKRCPTIPSDMKIRRMSQVFARYIEKEFGPFGEIGMDIGLDEAGQVWLLEANSKPTKLPEKKIEDTVGISPQFLMILEYARFLYTKKTSPAGSRGRDGG